MLDAAPHQQERHAVVVPLRRESQHRAQLGRQLALLDARGAEAHRARHVHHQHHRELALLDEALDERLAEAGRHVPVDVAHLVPGDVAAHLLELDAPPLEDALGVAREEVRDEMPAADLEPPDLAQQLGSLHALGHAHLLEDAPRDLLAVDALGLRLVGDVDAVAQHVRGDALHVLGQHVGPRRRAAPAPARRAPGTAWRGARRRRR